MMYIRISGITSGVEQNFMGPIIRGVPLYLCIYMEYMYDVHTYLRHYIRG